ncbi:unnamed protein product [Leuciscus chuanchicus]
MADKAAKEAPKREYVEVTVNISCAALQSEERDAPGTRVIEMAFIKEESEEVKIGDTEHQTDLMALKEEREVLREIEEKYQDEGQASVPGDSGPARAEAEQRRESWGFRGSSQRSLREVVISHAPLSCQVKCCH